MNKKALLVLVCLILAILTHGYLTQHYYPLKYGGPATNSFCQLGDKWDCDAAATSSYSSVLGIPLSVFGISFHIVLLLLVLAAWTGLTDHRQRTLRLVTILAGSSVFVSVILAIISATALSAWCPFCVLAYVFSFLIFIGLYLSLEEPLKLFLSDIPELFKTSKSVIAAVVFIPIIAFFTHASIEKNYGGDQLKVIVKSSVNEWRVAPAFDFSTYTPALAKGPAPLEASMTLVEFADFRCGHCGQAAPSVHAFLKGHPDVRFLFYNFPLDGTCNPGDSFTSGDGVSCRLAIAVTCAGKVSSAAGFALHDFVFENQALFQKTRSAPDVDTKLETAAAELNLNWEDFKSCLEDPISKDLVAAQAKAGLNAKIKGTPTFFVNGKKLSRGQFIPVLKAVYEASKIEKK